MKPKISKPEEEWRRQLTPEQYAVTREKATERAFTGEYHDCHDAGTYRCVGCGAELFSSENKFDSGSGWPSFWQPLAADRVATEADNTHGMRRLEVLCADNGTVLADPSDQWETLAVWIAHFLPHYQRVWGGTRLIG